MKKIIMEKTLSPISSDQAMYILIKYILGEDWYVVDPLSNDQINAIAVQEIKHKFDKLTHRKIKDRWNLIVDKLKFI